MELVCGSLILASIAVMFAIVVTQIKMTNKILKEAQEKSRRWSWD